MLMRREEGGEDRKEFRAGNCNDCNRQYCMEAHLPICKDAGAEDVVATCFREFFLPLLFFLLGFCSLAFGGRQVGVKRRKI